MRVVVEVVLLVKSPPAGAERVCGYDCTYMANSSVRMFRSFVRDRCVREAQTRVALLRARLFFFFFGVVYAYVLTSDKKYYN